MRADRLISLLLALQAKRRLTAAELATKLEVSERTIYRDIDALSFAGIPIYTQSGPNGGVFLDEGYRTSLARLTHSEIQSLILGTENPQLEDLGLSYTSEETLLKLLAALPSMQRDEAERMRQRFYIDPIDWFQQEASHECLPLLQQTVWESIEVRFSYQRRDGQVSIRTVQPYGLVAKSQAWYLVGADSDDTIKTFHVSRIFDVRLCENRFERRTNFDLIHYWKQSSQAYEHNLSIDVASIETIVKIDPEVRWFFTTGLPKRHMEIGNADEQGWVTLQVEFSSLISARQMILGLGDQIEIIEPVWLRDEIIQTLKRNIDRYSGQD